MFLKYLAKMDLIQMLSQIFKLNITFEGNGKRQSRILLAEFSFNFSEFSFQNFLSYVKRIITHYSFKITSPFTLYCLNVIFFVWRLTYGREA
jgi:hypothetical protein